jgi:hypothetical protein
MFLANFDMQLTRYQQDPVNDVDERQVLAERGDIGMRHSVDEEYRRGCEPFNMRLDKWRANCVPMTATKRRHGKASTR